MTSQTRRFHEVFTASGSPEAVAVVGRPASSVVGAERHQLTYNEASHRAEILAAGLLSLLTADGSCDGEQVLALDVPRSNAVFVPLLLAASRLGLPFVLLSNDLPEKNLERQRAELVFGVVKPRICIATAASRALHPQTVDTRVILVEELLPQLQQLQPPPLNNNNFDPPWALSPVFALMFTGGTQRTKIVRGLHSMVDHENRAYSSIWTPPSNKTSAILAHTSNYWAASSLGQLSIGLAYGGTTVFTEASEVTELKRIILEEGINILGVVPDHLDLLAPTDPTSELPGIDLVCTWGERLPKRISERWRNHPKARLRELLIATEYWLTFWADPLDDGQLRTVPGAEILVLTDANGQAAIGELGELCIAGPMLMEGYMSCDAGQPPPNPFMLFPPGPNARRFYRTNDLVRRTPNGVEYKGRADMMAKDKGKWVDMMGLQETISQLQGISGAKILADPEQERYHLFLSVANSHKPETVLDIVRSLVPTSVRLWVLADLPRHPVTRKIQEPELRSLLKPNATVWPLEPLSAGRDEWEKDIIQGRFYEKCWKHCSWLLGATATIWSAWTPLSRQELGGEVGALVVTYMGSSILLRDPQGHPLAPNVGRAFRQCMATGAWLGLSVLASPPSGEKTLWALFGAASLCYGWLTLTILEASSHEPDSPLMHRAIMAVVDEVPGWKFGTFVLLSLLQHCRPLAPGCLGLFALATSAGAIAAYRKGRLIAWPIVTYYIMGHQLEIDFGRWTYLSEWRSHLVWRGWQLWDFLSSKFSRNSPSSAEAVAEAAAEEGVVVVGEQGTFPDQDQEQHHEQVQKLHVRYCARCSVEIEDNEWGPCVEVDRRKRRACVDCATASTAEFERELEAFLSSTQPAGSFTDPRSFPNQTDPAPTPMDVVADAEASSTEVAAAAASAPGGAGAAAGGGTMPTAEAKLTETTATAAAAAAAATSSTTDMLTTASDDADAGAGPSRKNSLYRNNPSEFEEPDPKRARRSSEDEYQYYYHSQGSESTWPNAAQIKNIANWWWDWRSTDLLTVSDEDVARFECLRGQRGEASERQEIPPKTPFERELCAIVGDVEPNLKPLHMTTVLVGLDSLRLARLANAIRARLQKSITAPELREARTMEELSTMVQSTKEDPEGSKEAENYMKPPDDLGREFALWWSPGQMFTMGQWVLRADGPVDHEHLMRATQQLVDRHSALRVQLMDSQRYMSFVYDAAVLFGLYGYWMERGSPLWRPLRKVMSWAITQIWPRCRCFTREELYRPRYPETAAPLEFWYLRGQSTFEAEIKKQSRAITPPFGLRAYILDCYLEDVWDIQGEGRFALVRVTDAFKSTALGRSMDLNGVQLVYVDIRSGEYGPLVNPEDARWKRPPYGFPALYTCTVNTGATLWLRLDSKDEIRISYHSPKTAYDRNPRSWHLKAWRATSGRKREDREPIRITHLGFGLFHAWGDGNCYLPLIQDFFAYYEAARTGGPPPKLTNLPSPFPGLEQRLLDSINCRQSPLRNSYRGVGWNYRGNGFGHNIGVEPSATRMLQKACAIHRIPFDVALLTFVAIGMVRADQNEEIVFTLYTPMRDGLGDSNSVGLYADWRDLTIHVDKNYATILGTLLHVSQKIQQRQWSVFNPLRRPEINVVNMMPLDFERRSGFVHLGENMWWGGDKLSHLEEKRDSHMSRARNLSNFVIEQQDEETWWILASAADREDSWMRAFVYSVRQAFEDFLFAPLTQVHRPLPRDEDLLAGFFDDAKKAGYVY